MKISFNKHDTDFLQSIQSGDDTAMEKVYNQYRNEFVNWSKGKFGVSTEDALDHYQDTLVIFFEKVNDGSLKQIESSLKTYLFSIGKNRVRQQIERKARKERHKDVLTEHYRFLAKDNNAVQMYGLATDQSAQLIQSLGDGCKQVLQLFYFEKKSMTEIAKAMGHKSEAVSRTTKKRCLEKIRAALKLDKDGRD